MSERSNDSVDDDGRNLKSVVCKHCKCVILKPGIGRFVQEEKSLPVINNSNKGEKTETLTNFWCVEDIYLFENMGFSHTVDNVKYLACAECDIGPIGWHDLNDKKSYIATNRIGYL